MNTNDEQQKEAAGIIARILVALKVPGNWAKVIAGAIMGAIAAWMGMTQTSCAAQGQVVATRDGRVLTWDRATHSLVWTQAQPETDCPPIVQREK